MNDNTNPNLPFSILPEGGIQQPRVEREPTLCPQCNQRPRLDPSHYCGVCEEKIAMVHRRRPGTGG
jgi:hypothetical protein